MVAHAGAAAWVADDASRVEEDVEESLFHRLAIDDPGGGDDDRADGDLLAFEYPGGKAEVLDASVGAGAEERLVDRRALYLFDRRVVVDLMRLRDAWRDVAEVIVELLRVDSVVVGPDGLPLVALRVVLYRVEDLPVGAADGVLRAELDAHVAEGHALGDAHILDPLAVEFNAHVVRSVGAHVADELEDEVLRRDAGLEFAGDDDLHALGDLEPELAGGPDRRHLGTADAGREGAVGAVGAGVAVAAHHDEPGKGIALFAHLLMADAAFALHVVEVGDALLLHEFADLFVVHGVVA
ncbi:hypothetical protein SDC9_105166 [bioreactor metagenome]|uniref:Uncharacterized protein n=1 Tax=bioreactor metagenome TaxID=1076179 RepID=A0A645AYL2_9ZZZZ